MFTSTRMTQILKKKNVTVFIMETRIFVILTRKGKKKGSKKIKKKKN